MTKRERKERRWQKRRAKQVISWSHRGLVIVKCRSVGLSTLENLMGNHCKGTQ